MKNTIAKILGFATMMVVAIPLAFAMSVESAKSQGLVGERLDGLLGVVGSPTPELRELVETTNAERIEKYKGIAQKRGTDLKNVQAFVGKKLTDSAAPGEYIQSASGGWQKK
ncbi:MAG TPA: YdbL family protein [Alphaproteobacteria bacterium]|mgnify:CR=1 FL=1|nr:YdbL family protein [Alphaproteobacteria bacterium]